MLDLKCKPSPLKGQQVKLPALYSIVHNFPLLLQPITIISYWNLSLVSIFNEEIMVKVTESNKQRSREMDSTILQRIRNKSNKQHLKTAAS